MKVDSSNQWLDESFQIKLRNHKERGRGNSRSGASVSLDELGYHAKIRPVTKTNAQTIEFRIPVKADEETTPRLHRPLFVLIDGLAVPPEII